MAPPHVVILGAGYAGALTARALEDDVKKGKLRVTVVERRDAVHHKIGAIRASVVGGEWVDRVRVPLTRVIRNARTVIGNVVKVDGENHRLVFDDPKQEPLEYDVLVAATGTLNHSPGDLPPSLTRKDDVRAYFSHSAQAIREAKDVTIVGGGPSACEYAGEIRAAYPDKPITIVSSAANLLTSCVAPLTPKFMKLLYESLEKQNIKLIRGEKVLQPDGTEFINQKFKKGPLTIRTAGEKGVEFQTDLLLWAATWAMNTSIYPDVWLNDLSEVNVLPTFQCVEDPRVFAVGDVSSVVETKQAITLPPKIKVLRHNILTVAAAMEKGVEPSFTLRGLKEYRVTDKATMYLPIGPTKGVSQVGGWTYGDAKTSKFKGKDLYTTYWWTMLTGAGAPPVVEDA